VPIEEEGSAHVKDNRGWSIPSSAPKKVGAASAGSGFVLAKGGLLSYSTKKKRISLEEERKKHTTGEGRRHGTGKEGPGGRAGSAGA